MPKNTKLKECSKHGVQKDNIGTEDYPLLQCSQCTQERRKLQEDDEEKRSYVEMNKAHARALDDSNVPARYRFIMEYKGSAQAEAYAKVEQFFSPDGAYGALLLGHVGTGKTQMVCQLMSQWFEILIREGREANGLYSTLFDIILAVKESWHSVKSTSEVMDTFVAPDILIIDEVDSCYMSETECLYTSRIIDMRYMALKKTVVIGNVSIKNVVSIIGEKAVSRLLEGTEPVVFDWESYRKKK